MAMQGALPLVITVDPDRATYPLRDESLSARVHPRVAVRRTNTTEWFGAYQKLTGRGEVPFSGFANETDAPGPRQRLARFIRGNFFLPDARRGWNRHAVRAALEWIQSEAPQSIITTGPPHSTHLAGLKIKQRTGLFWVADFRDPWTEIYYNQSLSQTALARAWDTSMEAQVLRHADLVLVVSQDMHRNLVAKGVSPERIAVIPNGYEPEELEVQPAARPDCKRYLVYTGTLADSYPMDGMLTLLRHNPDVVLEVVGRVSERWFKALQSLPNAILTGYVPHHEALAKVRAADALLLVIPNIPGNEGILTGKLFEYLGSGKPILGIGPVQGDAAEMVRSAGAGLFVAGHDTAALTQWLQAALPVYSPPKAYTRSALTAEVLRLLPSA